MERHDHANPSVLTALVVDDSYAARARVTRCCAWAAGGSTTRSAPTTRCRRRPSSRRTSW